MPLTSEELREKRAKLIKDNRDLIDRAEADGRPTLNADEERQWDERNTDIDKLAEDIKRVERQEALESEMDEPARDTRGFRPEPNAGEDRGAQNADERRREEAFNRFLRSGVRSLQGDEFRALQADDDEGGGFLKSPIRFAEQLIKAVDDMVFMRQLATVEQVGGSDGLGAPTLESDPDDPIWTSELGTGDEDDAMKFGGRELKPNPLAKRIKVSRKLLRNARRPIDQLIIQRLSYKFGIVQENAFLNGTGAGQPLGIFTPSDKGIPTSRDVSEDNTTTTLKADNLINCKYKMKAQYWERLRWLFHRDAMKQLRKLKDNDGQYLLQPNLRDGSELDTLLNVPVVMSEHVPNTFTTGKYVGALGDFRHYWIVDSLGLEIQRLEELYAETNQIGFIGRLETDGQPVLAEAFVRVKLA